MLCNPPVWRAFCAMNAFFSPKKKIHIYIYMIHKKIKNKKRYGVDMKFIFTQSVFFDLDVDNHTSI